MQPTAIFDSKQKTIAVYGRTGAEVIYHDIVSMHEIEYVINKHAINWPDVYWKVNVGEWRFYRQFKNAYNMKRICYHCDTNKRVYVADECIDCFYADTVRILNELGE